MKYKIISVILVLTLVFGLIPSYASITAASIIVVNKYNDIKGNWAEQAIASFADVSVFADKDGEFSPSKPISRSEFVLMVHIILNALKYELGRSLPVNNKMPILFRDDGKIAESYKSDVYRALLLNLVYGRGNGIFDPVTAASRAEAAVMMSRLVETAKALKQ